VGGNRHKFVAVSQRTLWEEGRTPGRLVAAQASGLALLAVLATLLLSGDLTPVFDLAFVVICVAAALAVRPRDFFVVGVLPPLLMLGTLLVLAVLVRGAIAEPGDGLIQAVVSGLAHHANALVVGYALTLLLLALRQVAAQQKLPAQAARQRRQAPEPLAPPSRPARAQRTEEGRPHKVTG